MGNQHLKLQEKTWAELDHRIEKNYHELMSNCLFYGIDLEKMANDPNLLSNMGSSQSSMVINFIKTFPPS